MSRVRDMDDDRLLAFLTVEPQAQATICRTLGSSDLKSDATVRRSLRRLEAQQLVVSEPLGRAVGWRLASGAATVHYIGRGGPRPKLRRADCQTRMLFEHPTGGCGFCGNYALDYDLAVAA